jgi:hypothetical protein
MKRTLKITLAAAALLTSAALPAGTAEAQAAGYRFTIDERSSLAWWQMSPHLNHLWATTCPMEPSWQPGEERGSGWAYDPKRAPKKGYAAVVDTLMVPIFPRPVGAAQPICPSAVRGEIVAADTNSWRGIKGLISIRAETFVTGLNMRDEYAKKAVFQAQAYPDIRFYLDSVVDVQRGDTMTGKAYGQFELRGVKNPMVVPIRAWREAGGMRVTGKANMNPAELVEKYRISQVALGLGVGTGLWKYLHLGLDVVLRKPGDVSSLR